MGACDYETSSTSARLNPNRPRTCTSEARGEGSSKHKRIHCKKEATPLSPNPSSLPSSDIELKSFLREKQSSPIFSLNHLPHETLYFSDMVAY